MSRTLRRKRRGAHPSGAGSQRVRAIQPDGASAASPPAATALRASITNGWIICWSEPFASSATTAMISA